MTILNNLKKLHAAVVVDRLRHPNPTLGPLLNATAVRALTGGIESDEWKSYMAIFADNEAQLTRLTVADPGEPPYLAQLRAYMVSNSICDIGTNTHTGKGVDNLIDDGLLTDAPDGIPVEFRPAELKKIPEVDEV